MNCPIAYMQSPLTTFRPVEATTPCSPSVLRRLFSIFDTIASRLNVQKVETAGKNLNKNATPSGPHQSADCWGTGEKL